MGGRSTVKAVMLKIAVAAAVFAIVLYGGALATLYSEQRTLLFVRGRHERPADPVYRVRAIAERDGTRLTVWEAPRVGAPVIVFFYGNAGTLSDFAAIGEALHAQGYGIVLASYRGYSGNGGAPSEDGLMADGRAVLASLDSAHGPVVLWGQSLGTGVAARMAAEGRCAALILQSPYTSIADVAAWHYPIFPVHWLMRDRFDTASAIDRVRMPVLIMSGTADATVPFAMGEALAARLGRRADLIPFPGGGHDLPEWGVYAAADKWLHAHMPVAVR